MPSTLDRQRERFRANPGDTQVFEALEEHYFLNNEWGDLISLYEHRLRARVVQQNPRARARVLFRMAQVQGERLGDPGKAAAGFQQVLQADPQFRPAFRELRQIHTSRGQWEVSLQIGEAEAALPMRPDERAELLTELGTLWLDRVGDGDQALGQFERALAELPTHVAALEGAARALEIAGRAREAAAAWERVIAQRQGAARAAATASLARLTAGPLGRPDQAAEFYRRALGDDPHHPEALEALAAHAAQHGHWELLADLQERRFELANPTRRCDIAIQSGRLHLDRLDNPEAARLWLARARSLAPDRIDVHQALADLSRERGDDDALLEHLERVIALDPPAAPVSVLLEAASLRSERREDAGALVHLRRALERAPGDALVFEALSDSLTRLGRDDELIELLEHRATLAGADTSARAAALAELGGLHARLGDLDAARQAYGRAFEASPAAPGVASALEQLLRKARSEEALRVHLETASRVGPPAERPRALTSLGDLLGQDEGGAEEAVRSYEAALALDPTLAAAHTGLQRLAHARGDADAVLHAYEREASVTNDATRLGVLVPELIEGLGAAGRPAEALRWAQRWVHAAPESTTALSECGRLHEQLGQTDALRAILERLDGLLVGEDQAANHRRLAALHSAAGRSEDAVRAYRAALTAHPADTEALDRLCEHLSAEGRFEELARARWELVDLLPPGARAACLEELASLLSERLGDIQGALDALIRLADESGAPADVEERIGTLLTRSERYEERARRLADRVARLPPGCPEAVDLELERARVHFDDLGDCASAVVAYRRVRDWDPSSRDAWNGLEQALEGDGDPKALVGFFTERAKAAPDRAERDRCIFRQAELLDEAIGATDRARAAYEHLVQRGSDVLLRKRARERLIALLERAGAWQALREQLQASLEEADHKSAVDIHERIARIDHQRLGDLAGACAHFEASIRLDPSRAAPWRELADLYEKADRPDDLVRAIEAEIATRPEPEREITLRSRAAELCAQRLADAERARAHAERVLELDPAHAGASEFLVDQNERDGRPEAVVELLESRLAAIASMPEDAEGVWASQRTSLRLRVAGLRARRLEDLDGAIAALEPAIAEIGPQPVVAEPLADLYQSAGYLRELVELCRSTAEAIDEPSERAGWLSRLADGLRELGRLAEAAEVYRRVLSERPEDRDAQAILRDLYRRLDEPEPLARLLEVGLTHLAGPEEVIVRLELACLLSERLELPSEALLHLRRALQVGGPQLRALRSAVELAVRVDEPGLALEMLDEALAQPQTPTVRAEIQSRRGDLLAGALARPADAVGAYRDALAQAPSLPLRPHLRAELEVLGRCDEALACLREELGRSGPDDRLALIEHGVALARKHGVAEDALAWLERLRRERPDDPAVYALISETRRRLGEPEALLRALAEEAAVTPEPARWRELHRERAHLLERELGSPRRAAAALEAAREWEPDPEVLEDLDRLYGELGIHRRQAEVLEARLAAVDGEAAVPLHRRAAELFAGPLGDPQRSVAHLLRAVDAVAPGSSLRAELLRALGGALRRAEWIEAWARCAEAELRALDANAPVFEDRRRQLHRELAGVYETELSRPGAALRHLRPLLRAPADGDAQAGSNEDRAAAEEATLRLLRGQGSWIELEGRLAEHVSHSPESPERWLELARLRDEQLRRPAAAAQAFREVLVREPQCLPALRGLRSVAERLGDWNEVARTLEAELEHPQRSAPLERAALYQRLGDVHWHQLESTTRASRAYAAALEANAGELGALRSLQQLLEAMEDWRGALDLYASEIEVLGERERERRVAVWIRTAEIARDHTADPRRAIRAFQQAAALAPLPLDRRLELAELHRAQGEIDEFVVVFASWLDDPASGAGAGDHVRLAETLAELDETGEALDRADRALVLDEAFAPAWITAAQLYESQGQTAEAAGALERAAQLEGDADAAQRLLRAAELTEQTDTERAGALVREAASRDPGSATVQAAVARIAAAAGAVAEAETAARLALDLAASAKDYPAADRLETALVGGRAARERERFEAAAEFFAAALAIAPDHTEAQAGAGEALDALGDLAAAGRVLESRLAAGDPYPRRALHRSIVGRSLAADGDEDAARALLEAAIAEDASLDSAHAALVSLHERADRIGEGVAGLERWADQASSPADFAGRLLRAAEWELRAGDRDASAEAHLRAVIEAAPEIERTWEALAELLWREGRASEASDVSERALASVQDPAVLRSVALVLGRSREQLGDARGGAEAFGVAAATDPRCAEAALAQARLLRGLGEWRAAGDALETFSERHPGDDPHAQAEVLQQLGRLLAGPLENVERAVAVYRRAVELDPGHVESRAALAELLSYHPRARTEALAHHRQLLDADPTHLGSLRVLLRMAQVRNRQDVVAYGVRILEALGLPPPVRSEYDPAQRPFSVAGECRLARPLWEKLRRLAQEGASEIALALEASETTGSAAASDPRTAFRAASLAAEGRLTAPALVPLPTREVASVLKLLAALVLEPEAMRGDGRLVNALAAAVGRRQGKRLRRVLAGVSLAEIEAVDFDAWREEVRGLAFAVALDEGGGDLRTALLTLVCENAERPEELPDSADLRPFVAACSEARALLRRAVRVWLDHL